MGQHQHQAVQQNQQNQMLMQTRYDVLQQQQNNLLQHQQQHNTLQQQQVIHQARDPVDVAEIDRLNRLITELRQREETATQNLSNMRAEAVSTVTQTQAQLLETRAAASVALADQRAQAQTAIAGAEARAETAETRLKAEQDKAHSPANTEVILARLEALRSSSPPAAPTQPAQDQSAGSAAPTNPTIAAEQLTEIVNVISGQFDARMTALQDQVQQLSLLQADSLLALQAARHHPSAEHAEPCHFGCGDQAPLQQPEVYPREPLPQQAPSSLHRNVHPAHGSSAGFAAPCHFGDGAQQGGQIPPMPGSWTYDGTPQPRAGIAAPSSPVPTRAGFAAPGYTVPVQAPLHACPHVRSYEQHEGHGAGDWPPGRWRPDSDSESSEEEEDDYAYQQIEAELLQ